MLTLKKKELKELVKTGKAIELTPKKCDELLKQGFEKIGVSVGIYGISGGLIEDKNGDKYAILNRSTLLFKIF